MESDKAEQIQTLSNCNIDLYIRASGDFTSIRTADRIPISYLCYSDYGHSIPKAIFTIYNVEVINNWKRPNRGISEVVPVYFYFEFPLGILTQAYNATIYNTAVKHDSLFPLIPNYP